ncbi:beta-lactamase-like protein [Diplogelasinospora grovesii]|uniref:Beta-lactamase-like protein n=1 Tax=Diplogelasinospora grovesii TaxID=303347 RepID=A0AAN6S2Y8_9PEZI|nr:beta-lactamase-like protein [Diplogelasinospora grovesii]
MSVVKPKPAPDLGIPPSSHTVDVSIIDSTTNLKGLPTKWFMTPAIPGHDSLGMDRGAPAFSFLIQHPTLNRTLVFDLGLRKDWQNLSPALTKLLNPNSGLSLTVQKNVRDILDESGLVDTSKIEAVVWSHHHFDHTGDPSTLDASTALIVGPGFKEAMVPGYPANPESTILESDYTGRELIELNFDTHPHPLKIGRFKAVDYFGDGSFYLLDSPGHAVGHICGLARVTSDPASFILMGGDAFHHGGEIRPSEFLPLPTDIIMPDPFTSLGGGGHRCPGEMFESLLPDGDRTKTFYEPARLDKGQVHHNVDQAIHTIRKLQEADVQEYVLVAAAHDDTLLDVVDFFPQKMNDFVKKGWVQKARWRFLRDFAEAVGYKEKMGGEPPKM